MFLVINNICMCHKTDWSWIRFCTKTKNAGHIIVVSNAIYFLQMSPSTATYCLFRAQSGSTCIPFFAKSSQYFDDEISKLSQYEAAVFLGFTKNHIILYMTINCLIQILIPNNIIFFKGHCYHWTRMRLLSMSCTV